MPDDTMPSRSRPSTKLQDFLMTDKPTLSYADFHHQITRNTDSNLPKSFGSQQSHGGEGEDKKDELVRYMSNLPSYLEKGKNIQEKPLNVGVLDWRRLEKWKSNNNQAPHKNSGYSSSNSSTSYFSTEGSSSHSSRDQSSSPAEQRMQCSSLQSHLEAFSMKTDSQDECFPGRGRSFSPSRQTTCHLFPHSHHQKVYPSEDGSHNADLIKDIVEKFEGTSVSITDHRIRQQNLCGMAQTFSIRESGVMHKKKHFDNTTSEIGKQQSLKGKLRIRESELKEAMQSRISNPGDNNPNCPQERNTVVLLMPRDPAKNSRIGQSSGSTASTNRVAKEYGGNKFSEEGNYKEARGSDLSSSVVPHTCPLPSQEDVRKKSEVRECRSTSTQAVNVPSQQLKNLPSRSRNVEKKTAIVVLKSSSAVHLSGEMENGTGSQPSTKARHPSPIRRLGSAMGNIIRSAGSRDNSPLRKSSSKDSIAKPSLDRAADGRGRSSPLRRLLDPLIKPKTTNVSELPEPYRKDSAAVSGPCKLSEEQFNLPKAESVRVKPSSINAKTKGVKKESSKVQALLQVAVKNGLPLFTFAIDNDSDNIMAATLRQCSSTEKNRFSCIYTFLAVHEMKKKNAVWPSQGTKSKGHYVPNVVAQMTVLDRQSTAVSKQNHTDGDGTREFTLFSVDVSQADQHATEFQPTNELAAIVVKPQKAITGSQRSLSTTVILPGGVHTIPSKGSISTLAERWRSGGSCDCGGWDLGCQLRIFTNQSEFQNNVSSSNTSDEFKLYHQAGPESEIFLSMKPFKDRLYSVKFDSSISLLRAFAACIAFLDCRRPSALFCTSNLVEGRSSTSSVSEFPPRAREPNPPATSYISYPPNSPVGRV